MHSIQVEWLPYGKRFAISLVDDTDGATLAQIEPVYLCLQRFGIKATKTIWPLNASAYSGGYSRFPTDGDTLQQPAYRTFCEQLHDAGFEIAMHTASAGDSVRDETIKAYRLFEDVFGHPPFTNVMHARNRENIYWGKYSVRNRIVSWLMSLAEPLEFSGHNPKSEFYWGDICREKTRYVRQFETLRLNTFLFDPATPYHDPFKPDVRWWFSSSYGEGTRLLTLLSERKVETLAIQHGASIIHTYLHDFAQPRGNASYTVHPKFRAIVQMLARRADGWYVPVVSLLDRLRAVRRIAIKVNHHEIHISNESGETVHDLALATVPHLSIRREMSDDRLPRNSFGQVTVGTLMPNECLRLITDANTLRVVPLQSRQPNYARLVTGHLTRVAWQFVHGRHRFVEEGVPSWVQALSEAGTSGTQLT